MRAPRFWFRPASWAAWTLAPLGWLYGLVVQLRWNLTAPRKLSIPVICVGNFTLGGTGKTPAALFIAERLKTFGTNPFILTRGYGGAHKGPHRVDALTDSADQVGDEAMLLARRAPTIISRDRVAGAVLALSQGANVIIMDDGMQNPSLAKNLTLAVVDAASGLGNGLVFPAGPLRAHLKWQEKHADALLVMKEAGSTPHTSLQKICTPTRLSGSLQPQRGEWLKAKRVLGFCGIGRPEKFRATLKHLGAEVVRFESFPDHHRYSASDAKRLVALAARENLTLVTTEKDHVKLLDFPETRAQLAGLANALPVDFVPGDAAELDALLKRALSAVNVS